MTEALLTKDWQKNLANYSTLFVGFSGGLDSTVLLHSLANQPRLVGKLRAVHVHHGLSKNATDWQFHCQNICDTWDIPLIVHQVVVPQRANIEEIARIARYKVFSALLAENDVLLLAHHCNDQAETLLLQLLRGAGVDGLASMVSTSVLAKGEIARPFLEHSRQDLEAYAARHELTWIDDESNQDTAISRNYIRHQIMPLLQVKWPGVVGNLVRSARHCQHAKVNLESLATLDCPELSALRNVLAIPRLQELSYARCANVLRTWLKNNNVRLPSDNVMNRLINDVIFARADAAPMVQWGTFAVRRYQQVLYLLKNEKISRLAAVEWNSFPASLLLELHGEEDYLLASKGMKGLRILEGARVQVRFRQGGEQLYWHGQTKQLKKLFQQWHVPPWQRDLIPLLYIGNDLAAVVGYAISDHYYSENVENSYHVQLQSCADSRIMD